MKKPGTLQKDYFDTIYKDNADPWNFEKSEYEAKKYQQTMDSIPGIRYENGLEIGCSIGILTNMLKDKCENLLAIDISEKVLKAAQDRLMNYPNVTFKVSAIPDEFPQGNYDLIVMSEVGYYLSFTDLDLTIDQIAANLQTAGHLILVHWTHFVADYPISGDDVHNSFLTHKELFTPIDSCRTKDYRLDVLQRAGT